MFIVHETPQMLLYEKSFYLYIPSMFKRDIIYILIADTLVFCSFVLFRNEGSPIKISPLILLSVCCHSLTLLKTRSSYLMTGYRPIRRPTVISPIFRNKEWYYDVSNTWWLRKDTHIFIGYFIIWTAVTWMKYCRYGINFYSIIQSIIMGKRSWQDTRMCLKRGCVRSIHERQQIVERSEGLISVHCKIELKFPFILMKQ